MPEWIECPDCHCTITVANIKCTACWGKAQQGQSGATTNYIALAEKWGQRADDLENMNARVQDAHSHFQHGMEVALRKCAKELRAI